MEQTSSLVSKIRSAFLGLSVCDALGAPLEFQSRRLKPEYYITRMVSNHNFGLPPGHFTDDTSMALCLAHSLIQNQAICDAADQAKRYNSWLQEGYMSSLPGKAFDVGVQTRQVLSVWRGSRQASSKADIDGSNSGSSDNKKNQTGGTDKAQITLALIADRFSDEMNCGNGSLMRVLPCALVAASEEQAVKLARETSLVTHPHPRCLDASAIYCALVFHALRIDDDDDDDDDDDEGSNGKETLIQSLNRTLTRESNATRQLDLALRERLMLYSSVSVFVNKPRDEIKSSGYVVDSLEAALWAFFSTNTFEEGAIEVVNLGDDADTVGAIYGGLAGAFYGHRKCIPEPWLGQMQQIRLVEDAVKAICNTFHTSR